MRCVFCGPVPEGESVAEHLVSSVHRNMVDLDAHLRAVFYVPSRKDDE